MAAIFYVSLTQATNGFGTPVKNQSPLRGTLLKMKADGSFSALLSGLYAPVGIGTSQTPQAGMIVADQPQPGSLMANLYHSTQSNPIAYLPKSGAALIPSQALELAQGPYKGHWIMGDIALGGLKRIFVEEVEGQLQACVFRFSQGFEGGISRLAQAPDGSIYAGQAAFWDEWSQAGHRKGGLQRLSFTDETAFEMQAVRAKSNGLEIEFSQPISMNQGDQLSDYEVYSWALNIDTANLIQNDIQAIQISPDRRKVSLQLTGLKEQSMLIVHIKQPFVSETGNSLWSTEAWYTLNRLPEGQTLSLTTSPAPAPNTLSKSETANGWTLLFDGQSTNGWRNFGKEGIGEAWQVIDGALTLTAKGGGDIITEKQYENFELSLEWMISEGGNSGIFFNVAEGHDRVWHTGPEVQILDDLQHPDNKWHNHRSGSNYDLQPAAFEALNPVGEYNHMRLIVNQGKVEHWLNGYKIVEYELWTEEWEAMVKQSKFASKPTYGREKQGHIALQDHGDKVAFRNIKIRGNQSLTY